MFSGLVTALLREAPQQLFVDVAHLQARELVGAQGQFLVLVEDGGQPVVLHHQGDGGAVVEVLDDFLHRWREAIDVRAEVGLQQRMVFFIDLAQRPVGGVRERRQLGVDLQVFHQLGERVLGELGPLGQHFGTFGIAPGQQHAFEPPDDDDGQDDALVFIRLELATQALGGFPDFVGEVVELGFVERERH